MHGDQLCTDDIDYQRFRRKARNPIYRWFLARLPLARRENIATKWRRQSSQENCNKPSAIMDVNHGAVLRVMHEERATILVHGHTHRPGRHRLDEGQKERIVLGDWERSGWCLRSDQKGLHLLSFDIAGSVSELQRRGQHPINKS
jgi:UDP-2,3-diacylglucosamine hydrolase